MTEAPEVNDEMRPAEDPVPGEPVTDAETDRPRGGYDPRPPSQIEAEEGARDAVEDPDPRLRAPDIASARQYAGAGIMGAPGSEADPGGEHEIEPYPVQHVRTPAQAEAEGAESQRVPGVEGAPDGEPGRNAEAQGQQ